MCVLTPRLIFTKTPWCLHVHLFSRSRVCVTAVLAALLETQNTGRSVSCVWDSGGERKTCCEFQRRFYVILIFSCCHSSTSLPFLCLSFSPCLFVCFYLFLSSAPPFTRHPRFIWVQTPLAVVGPSCFLLSSSRMDLRVRRAHTPLINQSKRICIPPFAQGHVVQSALQMTNW